MIDHIRALTSIRFVFALMVLVCHAFGLLEQAGLSRGSPLANFINTGYVGVQFFFVLSGFILTYTYHGGQGGVSRKSFWIARFARIYPVYVLGLVLVLPFLVYPLLLLPEGKAEAVASLARTGLFQFTLTQAWVPPAAVAWNGPGWSLSVEAFFYLLFPFLLPRISVLRTPVLLALGAAVFLLSQSIAWLVEFLALPGFAGIPATQFEEAPGFWALLIACNPLVRLPEFIAGVIAAIVFLRHRDSIRPHAGWLTAGPAAVALFILFFLSPRIPIAFLNIGGLALVAAMFLVGLASHSGRLTRLLSRQLPVRLGEASYAIYILHVPIGTWMLWAIRKFVAEMNDYPLVCFFVYIFTVIGMSVVVFEYFEKPMRRAIRGRPGA